MTHVTCRLTAKNRDQLRNPTTFGNRVWATFTFLHVNLAFSSLSQDNIRVSVECCSGVLFQSVIGHGGYCAAFAGLEPHYSDIYNYRSWSCGWSSSSLNAAAAAAGAAWSPRQPTVNNSLFAPNLPQSYTALQ